MIYTSPNGEVVKDYKIVKKSDFEYVMDEGEIKISMKYLDNTFFDYYQLDSMYFTSTLRKIDSKTLMFGWLSISALIPLTNSSAFLFIWSFIILINI